MESEIEWGTNGIQKGVGGLPEAWHRSHMKSTDRNRIINLDCNGFRKFAVFIVFLTFILGTTRSLFIHRRLHYNALPK